MSNPKEKLDWVWVVIIALLAIFVAWRIATAPAL